MLLVFCSLSFLDVNLEAFKNDFKLPLMFYVVFFLNLARCPEYFSVNKFILQDGLSATSYPTIGMYCNLFNQSNRKPSSYFCSFLFPMN